jgi:ATP-dependent DNA ligase
MALFKSLLNFPHRCFSIIKKGTGGEDSELLENMNALICKLRATNSINAKVEIIKSYPALIPIFNLIHCPHRPFNIKSTSLSRYPIEKASDEEKVVSLFNMLENLADRKVTGKEAVLLVSRYINAYPEHEELIKNVIDKNIKARVGNDIMKRCAEPSSDIKCSLGYPIEKHMNYLKKSLELEEKWFISRKFDGIRMFLKYNHLTNSIEVLSRQMKQISGLNSNVLSSLQDQISQISPKESFILDGELVFTEELTDCENFSKTVSLVKSKDPKPIDGLKYKVFDCFDSDRFTLIFSERQARLRELFKTSTNGIISIVDQKPLSFSEFDSERLLNQAVAKGYEGFIVRKDSQLKSGRSRDLLKLKPWLDDEFKVVGHEIGSMRIIDETGTEKTEPILASIIVNFDDNLVHVGSGFTNSERIEFAKDPSKILNKIVTIKYQSESKVEGRRGNSLRFPIFKCLHGNERIL